MNSLMLDSFDEKGVEEQRLAVLCGLMGIAPRDELEGMLATQMLDCVEVEGKDAIVDMSALTRDQAAAISEDTVETYMEGKGEDAERVKRTKFKSLDPSNGDTHA
jgi:hypothetical protein